MAQRQKVIPMATGKVMEIGIGSGLNLPLYVNGSVKLLVGVDPSKEMWAKNTTDTERLNFDFEFIEASAQSIPVNSNYFDTIVTTYTLCTIPDLNSAFEEIRRVLKPEGKLLFCEHGKAPEIAVQKWQNIITPISKRLAGGCHWNRDIYKIIRNNGFNVTEMETQYITGWKPASFNYWGSATQQ